MYVADAIIEYEGKGPIGEKTSPGILTRILDWLGIF
jgi:flagellar basal body L-ring protein FlgH